MKKLENLKYVFSYYNILSNFSTLIGCKTFRNFEDSGIDNQVSCKMFRNFEYSEIDHSFAEFSNPS